MFFYFEVFYFRLYLYIFRINTFYEILPSIPPHRRSYILPYSIWIPRWCDICIMNYISPCVHIYPLTRESRCMMSSQDTYLPYQMAHSRYREFCYITHRCVSRWSVCYWSYDSWHITTVYHCSGYVTDIESPRVVLFWISTRDKEKNLFLEFYIRLYPCFFLFSIQSL